MVRYHIRFPIAINGLSRLVKDRVVEFREKYGIGPDAINVNQGFITFQLLGESIRNVPTAYTIAVRTEFKLC